jgi:transcriptional regulator with XRE-family HTH domain
LPYTPQWKWCRMPKMGIRELTTAGQGVEIRMARAGLGWSAGRLAHEARVGRNTVARVEGGAAVRNGTVERIRAALTAAGVRFGAKSDGQATVSVVVDSRPV